MSLKKRTYEKMNSIKSINIDDLDIFNLLKNRNIHLIFNEISNKIEDEYLTMVCYH